MKKKAQEDSNKAKVSGYNKWKKDISVKLEFKNRERKIEKQDKKTLEDFYETIRKDHEICKSNTDIIATKAAKRNSSETYELDEITEEIEEKNEEPVNLTDPALVETSMTEYYSGLGFWCTDSKRSVVDESTEILHRLRFADRKEPLPPPKKPTENLQILIIGQRFSGCSTQAQCLSKRYTLPIVSLSAIRSLAESEEELEKLKDEENQDEIHFSLFSKWLTKHKEEVGDEYCGFISDGFPNNEIVAMLAEKFTFSDRNLFILEGEEFSSRGKLRMIDPQTQNVFCENFLPIAEEIELRLVKDPIEIACETDANISNLVAFYESKGCELNKLDAAESVEEVCGKILDVLEKKLELEKENENEDENEVEIQLTTEIKFHRNCVSYRQNFKALQSEYEQLLRGIFSQITRLEEDFGKDLNLCVSSFEELSNQNRCAEKSSAILELQTSYNGTTKAQRIDCENKEKISAKISELNRYLWKCTLQEVDQIQQAQDELLQNFPLDEYMAQVRKLLQHLLSLECFWSFILLNASQAVTHLEQGKEFEQITYDFAEFSSLPDNFTSERLKFLEKQVRTFELSVCKSFQHRNQQLSVSLESLATSKIEDENKFCEELIGKLKIALHEAENVELHL